MQEALISEGLAVYWKGYAPAPLDIEGRLLVEQEQARKHKRGLWKEYAEELERISEEGVK